MKRLALLVSVVAAAFALAVPAVSTAQLPPTPTVKINPTPNMLCGAGCGVSGGSIGSQYIGCINAVCCNPSYLYVTYVIDLTNNHIEYVYKCDVYAGQWLWKQISYRYI